MTQNFEYSDAIRAWCQLLWGEGFLSPGGEGNVANLVQGLEIRGKRVLEIGSGLGGGACLLARTYGASVLGLDIAQAHIEISERRAETLGLESQTEFRLVEPGPLRLPDSSFDFVISSGLFTEVENKSDVLKEIFRVLKPGGVFSCYDWMKCEGEYSEKMLYYFELEGLIFALETPERSRELLHEAGFRSVSIEDRSDWYRREVREEYRKMTSELYPQLVECTSKPEAEHVLETWRTLISLCEKGEMLQVYSRGQKPTLRE
jgi:phosphoethanolamine N-methyltransferase